MLEVNNAYGIKLTAPKLNFQGLNTHTPDFKSQLSKDVFVKANKEVVFTGSDGDSKFYHAGELSEGSKPVRPKPGTIEIVKAKILKILFKKPFKPESDSKWGFANEQDKVIIKPQFNYARSFHEDLASVQLDKGGQYGFINKAGEMVIQPQFDYADDFSEGLAAVRIGEHNWGFINKDGEMVIQPKFYSVWKFSEGLAAVQGHRNGKIGFVDKTGTEVIKREFYSATNFKDGKSKVGLTEAGNNHVFIDKKGKVVN